MTNVRMEPLQIPVTAGVSVSGRIGIPAWWPSGHRTGLVLGHDTGGHMDEEPMASLHHGLVELGYLTLAFNFPFAEQKRKRPDAPSLLERTFRAAAMTLSREPQSAPAHLFLGGIGLGARVAVDTVAHGLTAAGVVCLGYPLHPSGKPNQQRADALFRLICPLLFVQGSRDPYCRTDRLEKLLTRVGAATLLHVVDDVGQGFSLPKRTTRTPEDVRQEVLTRIHGFLQKAVGHA